MTRFDAAGMPLARFAVHERSWRHGTVSLTNYLAADAARTALRHDVRHGLQQYPKSLPPKWFYDDTGSELFDRITRLPEYYPTRAETEILRAHSAEVAALSCADTLVELGSGTSEKTRIDRKSTRLNSSHVAIS